MSAKNKRSTYVDWQNKTGEIKNSTCFGSLYLFIFTYNFFL